MTANAPENASSVFSDSFLLSSTSWTTSTVGRGINSSASDVFGSGTDSSFSCCTGGETTASTTGSGFGSFFGGEG